MINEPFEKMTLGKNTTLSYVVSALELQGQVYIYNLPNSEEFDKKFPQNNDDEIEVIHLNLDENFCRNLVEKYCEFNGAISGEKLSQKTLEELQIEDQKNILDQKVSKILESIKPLKSRLNLRNVDFLIQRIEPMKAPFPPEGNFAVDDVLARLKKLFPQLIFNCPIGLQDKETPILINQILQGKNLEPIATPTEKFSFAGDDFATAITKMAKKYSEIFPEKNYQKIVLKPENSAQSLGVFAIEFSDDGDAFDLKSLKKRKIEKLTEVQIYKIKNHLSSAEIKEMAEVFCFAQSIKSDSEKTNSIFFSSLAVKDFTREKILQKARNLFGDKILVQPFLEGVKNGDIRANIIKNKDGDFYLAGCTFRKSQHAESKSEFTTCYTSGGASSASIEELSDEEQKDLKEKTKICLEILNGELREKYRDSLEIGIDFICVGNGKVFLGEINHHCPALLPVSEAMKRIVEKENESHRFGLSFSSAVLRDMIAMQKNGSGEGN